MILSCYIAQCPWAAVHAWLAEHFQNMRAVNWDLYYFSTHGWCCLWSSFPSDGFDFELLEAAAAAARALLLKKLAAIASCVGILKWN